MRSFPAIRLRSALVGALAVVGLFVVAPASTGAGAGPLTLTPVTWDVIGLDSNNVNTGPAAFPVGVKVCNTGTDPATNVVVTWAWKTSQNSFTGPADGATVSVGTMAGAECRQVFFEVTLNRSPSSRLKSRDYQITVAADGGLSVSGTQRQLYVEKLVSQNRNSTKKLAGPGGCNLAYTVCDPAIANVVVGRTYTYKFYAETSTAYQQLESFVNFPTSAVQVVSTSTTYSNPSGATSSSIYGDACGWSIVPTVRACVGPATIPGGKAGGRVVVTYVVRVVAPGSATVASTIYDFSGSSYHYNADHDSFALLSSAFTARYGLDTTIAGNGKVTSSPAGTRADGGTAGIDCGGSGTTCSVGYATGTSVTLTATPLGGDTFVGWSGGGCSGAALTCNVSMSQSRSVTATFTGVSSYGLDVTKAGSGTVTADSGAVNCGSTCAGLYADGTLVTLTASPSAGWSFDGWSGAGCSGTGTCQATMTQARSVTATFSEQTYALGLSVTGNGTVASSPGTVSCGNGGTFCSDTFGSGTVVTLTATPGSGQTFTGWSGDCSGSLTTCNVTMNQARSVIAAFSGTTIYPLDVGTGGSGTGTVTSNVGGINCGATCSATFADGTVVTLTASASGGSGFAGWSGDCSGSGTTCIVTMSQARNVFALFGTLQTLTVTKTGTGTGTVTSDIGGINCGATCSTSVAEGATVTLMATPSAGSVFTGWSNACSGTGACVVAMTGAKTATANFETAYTLTVSKAGSGSGTVTADSGAVNCGATCSGSYASGTVVTLTAAPAAGSRFAGWSGACSGTGSCVTTMSAARSVTATFVAVYTLSVSKTGAGSGTVTSDVAGVSCGATCSADYDSGTVVTLTASAASGSRFAGWSGACSGTGDCAVTMSAARSVSAQFVPTWTLSVSKAGSGSGSIASDVAGIACGPTCSADFDDSTVVTLSASPAAGSRFAGWSGACSGTDDCTVTMSVARSVTATFIALRTLTVSKDGSGSGVVSGGPIDCGATCAADLDDGTEVTLTASAASGSRFAGWSGACSGTDECTVTMSAARSVTATFVALRPLTVSKSGSGSGVVAGGPIDCGATCAADLDEGTEVTLTATPSAGSRFAGWSGACSGTDECTVTMSVSRSVTATFVATYPLAVSTFGTGSVSGGPIDCGSTCAADLDEGTVVTLTATPGSGHTFTGWSGACSGTDDCTVTMSAAGAVTASFAGMETLTVLKAGSGSGNVAGGPIDCGSTCSADLATGTEVTLTAAPAAGSRFAGWSGACSGTDDCTVTMSAARSVTATFVALHSLTVATTGSGSGAVAGGPIDCGSTCAADLDEGTEVTLTSTPSSGSRFAGWSGACSGTDDCTVTMSAARSVTATFVALHSLTIATTGSGSGAVAGGPIDCGSTCAADLDDGTEVTLTATPSAGSRFAGWSGACSGTDGCTVTMSVARSVTATFVAMFPLTVSTSGSGSVSGGPIDCGSTCAVDLDAGTSVTLTATPAGGSRFVGWTGGGCAGTGDCTVTMSAAQSVLATFVPVHTLTVTRAGSGSGTVTSDLAGVSCGSACSADYDDGAAVTLTPAAAAGSRFVGWTGACSGAGACTVTMSAARSVTAIFAAVYTLGVSKTGTGAGTVTGGTIDCGVTCAADFDDGTLVTLTAAAADGSEFAGWSGACSGTGGCTVTMSAARAVTAAFETIAVDPPADVRRNLTVGTAGSGSGVVRGPGISCHAAHCTETFDDGATVVLTATPGGRSRFVGWSGESCSTERTCTVVMTADRTVEARFVRIVPLRVAVRGRGAVTFGASKTRCKTSCRHRYERGEKVVLVARARRGSWFAGWSGACRGKSRTCAVTVIKASRVRATFRRNLELRISTPSGLVYHAPYERALVRAKVTWRGRPVLGADVHITVRCPLSRSATSLRTGGDGRVVFPYGTEMRDRIRVYRCRVTAEVSANGKRTWARPATLRFIHPLWLETKPPRDGRIVIRIWGRAGEHVVLHANGRHAAHAVIGPQGWVEVAPKGIYHGDRLSVGGNPTHHSHVIVA